MLINVCVVGVLIVGFMMAIQWLVSQGWCQDHNGFSHKDVIHVYLPRDANTLLRAIGRAVEWDYGNVLSQPQDERWFEVMAAEIGTCGDLL